jgi:Dolichyl-phosphate-mannose-protein mannosyltransferase
MKTLDSIKEKESRVNVNNLIEGIRLKWSKTIFILFLIILTSFALRVAKVFIGQQPVFADEAIYVRWAQVMKAEPTLRFLPQSDGKQPFYMWVLMFSLRPSFDPLIEGRMLSVFFGIICNLGVFILAYLLFGRKKAGLIAALMYAISPIAIFFDSMALVDTTLAMFGVWFLIFLILTIKHHRYDLSMISGFLLGGALLTKSPALYFSVLTPTSLILSTWTKKAGEIVKNIIKRLILLFPIYLIGYGIYNILRLGPNFQMIAIRNKDYIFPISHLWLNPKDPFIFHIKEMGGWLWMLGPGVLLFTLILGLIVGIKRFKKETIFLLFWILVPLFANAMYAKVFTTRYILFVMPFIYIISSLFIIFHTKYQKLSYFLLVLFMVNCFLVNYLLIFNIPDAPLPKSERTGYLEEWTAGYGIKEVAGYLISEVKNPQVKGQIVVGTEGYFGTLPDGLSIYLNNYPQITVIGVGLDIKEIPKSLYESKKAGNRTYLVINSSRLAVDPNKIGLKLINSYKKPLRTIGTSDYIKYGPRETLYFFEVL